MIKKILLFLTFFPFVSFSAFAGQKSFKSYLEESQSLSYESQVKFFRVIKDQQFAFKKAGTHVSQKLIWEKLFIDELWASGNQWCINNGFIAQVTCDRSNNWSFDVTQTEEYKVLKESNLGTQCRSGEQPCSLLSGVTSTGGVACSNNSTRRCHQNGSLEKLAQLRTACKDKVSVQFSGRLIQCQPIENHLGLLMNKFDKNCSGAHRSLQRLCRDSKRRLSQIINSGAEKSNTSETQNPTGDSVVMLGDSHLSCTPYGAAMDSCFRNQNWQATIMARGSAAPRHWRTGNTRGLQRLCGYRSNGSKITPRSRESSWNATQALRNTNASTLVLSLGDNLLGCAKNRNASCIKNQYRKLMQEARAVKSNLKCIFITPTQPTKVGGGSYRKTVAHTNFLRENITSVAREFNCGVVDGAEVMSSRARNGYLSGGDGVHLSSSDYRSLGQDVCERTLRLMGSRSQQSGVENFQQESHR